jgi:hypothetical protein
MLPKCTSCSGKYDVLELYPWELFPSVMKTFDLSVFLLQGKYYCKCRNHRCSQWSYRRALTLSTCRGGGCLTPASQRGEALQMLETKLWRD